MKKITASAIVALSLALTGCGSVSEKPGVIEQMSPFTSITSTPPTTVRDCAEFPYAVGCPAVPPPMPSEFLSAPEPKDFSIALSVKSKQCFGSAGCNLVVEPALSYLGANTLMSGYTCDLTYSIKGDEDGELIETAYNTGGTQYRISRTSISTPNSKTVPTAEVTSVSCTK